MNYLQSSVLDMKLLLFKLEKINYEKSCTFTCVCVCESIFLLFWHFEYNRQETNFSLVQ